MTINHSYVQVPNQTVKLDTVVMTIGSEIVSRQIVALGDPENGLIQSFTGTSANVNVTNTVDVNVSSMPLPTGAATASLQTAGNILLDNIDNKLPTLDGGYIPVNIKNATIAVTQSGSWNINNITGTISLPTGAATLTEQQAQTTSLGTDGASPPSIAGTGVRGWLRGIYEKAVLLVSGLTDGTQRTKITDGTNNNTILQIGTQVTSSNYGIVTNSVIHGLSTAGGGSYVDVKVNPSGSLAVDTGLDQPLTDAQLRASNVNVNIQNASLPVTQSGSWSVGRTWSLSSAADSVTIVPSGTQTISGTVTANAGTGNFNTKPDGTIWSLTGTSANVNITNTVSTSQSGTWNLNNISGTISLPTGAATSALQTIGNSTLSSIDGKLPALVSGNQPTVIQNTPSSPAATAGYTSTGGNALYDNAQSYSLNCITGAIGAIAAGVTVFAMRNTGAKTVKINCLTIESQFIGTAAATLSHFQVVRFTSATPTGGTALTVGKKATANAATSVGDARFAPAGLTVTGVAFADILAGHTQISQLAAQSETIIDQEEIMAHGRIVLAPNEGLCIRSAIATTVASTNLNINIDWEEV